MFNLCESFCLIFYNWYNLVSILTWIHASTILSVKYWTSYFIFFLLTDCVEMTLTYWTLLPACIWWIPASEIVSTLEDGIRIICWVTLSCCPVPLLEGRIMICCCFWGDLIIIDFPSAVRMVLPMARFWWLWMFIGLLGKIFNVLWLDAEIKPEKHNSKIQMVPTWIDGRYSGHGCCLKTRLKELLRASLEELARV